MGKYIAKRIGYMALVFLIVSFLMYSLYNLIPTDPARAELEAQKQSLKPAEYEQLRALGDKAVRVLSAEEMVLENVK